MGVVKGKKIIGLPVETESGISIGKIFDFELETASQSILRYYIRDKNILKEFFVPELIVYKEQVVFIDDNKMVIEDNVIKAEEKGIVDLPTPIV